MANGHRGEIYVVLNGKIYTLRLTLGALAELEKAFGSPDIAGLAGRFEHGRLSAHDLKRLSVVTFTKRLSAMCGGRKTCKTRFNRRINEN